MVKVNVNENFFGLYLIVCYVCTQKILVQY